MKKQLLILFLVALLVCSVFTACGDDNTLAAVVVDTQPTKTEYNVGDSFDLTGAKLELTFTDGTTQIVDVTEAMLKGGVKTFTQAGVQEVEVSYTVGDVTKTAKIMVTVKGDATPATPVNSVDTARANALASLQAYYESFKYTTPDAEKWAAPDEDLAAAAKAAYDTAVAAIESAEDAEGVNALLSAAKAQIANLDNYLDWYAAKTVSEIEKAFDAEYTARKEIVKDYGDKLIVMKRQTARILRAETLEEIDALRASLNDELASATDELKEFAEKLVKFAWKIDLPDVLTKNEDGTFEYKGDATDANVVLFYEIQNILADKTDAYRIELRKCLANYPADKLTVGNDAFGALVKGLYYDATAKTYDLASVMDLAMNRMGTLFAARTAADCGNFVAVISAEEYNANILGLSTEEVAAYNAELLKYFDVKDFEKIFSYDCAGTQTAFLGYFEKDSSVEAKIAAAVKMTEEQIIAGETSEQYLAICAVEKDYEAWVKAYGVDTINLDLVCNYSDLLALFEEMQNILDHCHDEDRPELRFIYDIKLGIDDQDIAKERDIAEKHGEKCGFRSFAQFINDDGKAEYIVKGYENLIAAEARLQQLKDAKTYANTTLKAAIDALSKDAIVFGQYSAVEAVRADYDKMFDGEKFQIRGFTITNVLEEDPEEANRTDIPDTVTANTNAIFAYKVGDTDHTAAEYLALITTLEARVTELNTAKENADTETTGLIDVFNAIDSVITLDHKADLSAVTDAYTTWKSTYHINDINDGAVILGDAYTKYDTSVKYYESLTNKLAVLNSAINALSANAGKKADVSPITNARALFEELVIANSDTSAEHATTYKYVVLKDDEGQVAEDLYAKLVALEANAFSNKIVNYANDGLAKLFNERNTLIAKLGSGRSEAVIALNEVFNQAAIDLHKYESADYSEENVREMIYSNEYATDAKTDYQALYEEVAGLIDEMVETYSKTTFLSAIGYVIMGDATNGYSLLIYGAGTYDAELLVDVNIDTPASYNEVRVLTDGEVVLKNVTADTVIYGNDAQPDTLDAPKNSLKMIGGNVTTLNVYREAEVELENTALTEVMATEALTFTCLDEKGEEATPVKFTTTNENAKLSINAPSYAVVLETKANEIEIKADALEATIFVAEGAQAPTVKAEIKGDVSLAANVNIDPSQITSEEGEVVAVVSADIKDFGYGSEDDEETGWTDPY